MRGVVCGPGRLLDLSPAVDDKGSFILLNLRLPRLDRGAGVAVVFAVIFAPRRAIGGVGVQPRATRRRSRATRRPTTSTTTPSTSTSTARRRTRWSSATVTRRTRTSASSAPTVTERDADRKAGPDLDAVSEGSACFLFGLRPTRVPRPPGDPDVGRERGGHWRALWAPGSLEDHTRHKLRRR